MSSFEKTKRTDLEINEVNAGVLLSTDTPLIIEIIILLNPKNYENSYPADDLIKIWVDMFHHKVTFHAKFIYSNSLENHAFQSGL